MMHVEVATGSSKLGAVRGGRGTFTIPPRKGRELDTERIYYYFLFYDGESNRGLTANERASGDSKSRLTSEGNDHAGGNLTELLQVLQQQDHRYKQVADRVPKR